MSAVCQSRGGEVGRLSRMSVGLVILGSVVPVLVGCAEDANKARFESLDSRSPEVTTILWEEGVKNAYPRWSRDGSQILFQSDRSGTWQIYVMTADGTNQVALTSGEFNNNFPSWSADNSLIAFVSDRDGNEEIYLLDPSDGTTRNLSNHPDRDIHPYWSPDGRTILFNSDREDELLQIYEMKVDGSGLRRLVASEEHDTCARISPAGDRFIYLSNLAIGQDDVLMRDRNGSQGVNITDDEFADGWPTWTPDGRRIVFATKKPGTFSLYSMRPDGTDRQRITFPEAHYLDARPDISPDGRRIVFNREDDTTIGIFVVDVNGTAVPR